MARKPYPTDLTDEMWEILSNFIPPAKTGGRPRGVDVREVLNALIARCRYHSRIRSPPTTVHDEQTQSQDTQVSTDGAQSPTAQHRLGHRQLSSTQLYR